MNSKKVARILKSNTDRTRCEDCQMMNQDSSGSLAEKANDLPSSEKSPLPGTAFRSPAVKTISSNKNQVATPNRKPGGKEPATTTPGSRPGTAMSSSNVNSDKSGMEISDIDALKADSENFMALGIKLKHETDRALGLKSSDGVDLVKGAVYAVHCIMYVIFFNNSYSPHILTINPLCSSYLVAFGLEDEIRKRDKRSPVTENWKQVAYYIEFLLTSRLKANLPLHGLL